MGKSSVRIGLLSELFLHRFEVVVPSALIFSFCFGLRSMISYHFLWSKPNFGVLELLVFKNLFIQGYSFLIALLNFAMFCSK